MYSNHLNPSEAKVTVSCRVLPQHKLLLAERARSMSMSLAQYVEAKVLQDNTLVLQEKIDLQRGQLIEQKKEIEALYQQLEQAELKHTRSLNKVKTTHSRQIKELEIQINELKERKELTYSFTFSSNEQYVDFMNKLKGLADKYKLGKKINALDMCIKFAIDCSKSFLLNIPLSEFAEKYRKK